MLLFPVVGSEVPILYTNSEGWLSHIIILLLPTIFSLDSKHFYDSSFAIQEGRALKILQETFLANVPVSSFEYSFAIDLLNILI